METTFAIAYTKPGTMLTFWLNRFHAGGFIWSLVRTPHVDTVSYQPALRFASLPEAQAFIVSELGSNPDARVVRVED